MQLSPLDWSLVLASFAIYLAIGVAVSRKAGSSFSSYFLSGRHMPWWLLGISMVATTFSTDTPNLVADIVRQRGVFGNWIWWAYLLTGMTTVFLYAKLWRRSQVFTDIEFYELRYSGRPAAFLRGFRAVYLGLVFNVAIMASVTLAAIKIGGVMLGLEPLQTVAIAASVTVVYSALGGLTGVLLTDVIQFAVAMVGSIWAAVYLLGLPEVGGLSGLIAHPNVQPALEFLPTFERLGLDQALSVFLLPIAVQWWATYYPGAEPGGGGYVVQRVLAARDERHAALATLLFNVAHYALRPWPWILVALASLVVFPDLGALAARFPEIPAEMVRHDLAYSAMLTYLPAGLLGLVLSSLIAAYMSTMSTQVNWGSSILVNDLYQRFFARGASEKRKVWAGRLATVFLMAVSCTVALWLESALEIFEVVLQIGAGTGLLLMLRWFWWRVNAAAEITAMAVSFAVALVFHFGPESLRSMPDWQQLTGGVAITTVAWVLVALLTPPTDPRVLRSFYERIRPGGPGWRPVLERARREGVELSDGTPSDLPASMIGVVCGLGLVYGLLFATGFALYGRPLASGAMVAVALVAGLGLATVWRRLSFR